MTQHPPLIVFPSHRIPGGVDAYPPRPFSVITDAHTNDAHAAGYLLPTGERCPRINLDHLAAYIDRDCEPVLNYVFCDIDNEDHAHWTPDQAELHWAKLKKDGPDMLNVAGFYSTRGGYRLLFQLARPLPVSVAGHFIEQLFDHLRAGGIPVDPACVPSWNTLYRLPRVTRDGQPLAAFVDMDRLAPLHWVAPMPLKSRVNAAIDTTAKGPRPEPRTLTDQEWERIAGVLDGPTFNKLIEAKPLTTPGKRQHTMFKIAAALVGKLRLDSPELAYQALGPSVAAAGGVSLDDTWKACQRALAMDLAKRAAEKQTAEDIAAGSPPILYDRNGRFYIYDVKNETYAPPVQAVGIYMQLERLYKPCRPGAVTTSPQNRPLSSAEYLTMYGEAIGEVIAEMGREKSVYRQGNLIEGCCVPAKVTPAHNPHVAEWLRLLAGGHHEKLLDWLATVTRLSDPTAAIYLQGPPSIGKGLLANGVASLWPGGATSFGDATGKFNGALCRNPLVYVDEISQTFDGGDGFSGSFRSLISESSRQLRRKNLPSGTLRGCPRLIIAANNSDALRLRESLTKADLEAIALRILHIQADDQAARYLEKLGGRAFTKFWVTTADGGPGVIAAHIAHLAATREVQAGSRFLVEGVISDWHRGLMGCSGVQGDVLAALAKYRKDLHRREVVGIEFDDRGCWVNGPALRGQWELLLRRPPPDENTLARALRVLSNEKTHRRRFGEKGTQKRCYLIELGDIDRRDAALQISDLTPDTWTEDDEYTDDLGVIPF
jgi:hypothetical protein